MVDVIESGRLGEDLLKAALSALSAFKASEVSGPMMLAVLEVRYFFFLRLDAQPSLFFLCI